ncbi:MAG: hypothetical protein WC222_11030 [Parachlamydiales bacterium]
MAILTFKWNFERSLNCVVFLLFCLSCLHASEKEIQHVDGTLKYIVETDWLPVHLKDPSKKAAVFYVAYHVPSVKPRPVTFCFNGGPGSASVWIHMAGVGPRSVKTPVLQDFRLPIQVADNPFTLLSVTDLVFVDAVYTGFSRPEPPTPAADFFSYNADIDCLSNFIDSFIQTHNLGEVPLYLLGCSYGTLRVAGLADALLNTYHHKVSGLIMLSALLNFQSLTAAYQQNDSPYPLLIPTFAVASWYHSIGDSRNYTEKEWMDKATAWAAEKYLPALMQGDSLSREERSVIAQEMSAIVGIDKELIELRNLRLDTNYYIKELLRKENRTIGRFDIRYKGIDSDVNRTAGVEADPSYIVMGTIAAGFQDYLKNELHFEVPTTPEYFFLGKASSWHYVNNGLHFLCLNKKVSTLMERLPEMKIFVGSGIYDLATPYRVIQNDFSHLNLSQAQLQNRFILQLYEGGHMFYTDSKIQEKLYQDVKQLY